MAKKTLKLALLAVAITGACTLWLLTSRHASPHVILLDFESVDTMKSAPKLHIMSERERKREVQSLSLQVMGHIKTFVFFVGSGRSGHSIVGSLMDAHPHVVISHEYHIFRNWLQFYHTNNQNLTQTLLGSLYHKSVLDASDIRNSSSKGYSLKLENLWQGNFDRYIDVIGDKSGGSTTQEYIKNKTLFKMRFNILKHDLSMPVRIIHVVRNPFDHIATRSLYDSLQDVSEMPSLRSRLKPLNGKYVFKFKDDQILRKEALEMFTHYKAALEMTELFGRKNVLEVHISDLIRKPKSGLRRIFKFVGVSAPGAFLDACSRKLFVSASRTRDLVVWPEKVKALVEKLLKDCKFLSRYTFTSD